MPRERRAGEAGRSAADQCPSGDPGDVAADDGAPASLAPEAMLPLDWPLPAGVRALMSMRSGGVSRPPFDSLNLGAAEGDAAADLAENRNRFACALGATPAWLRQVHGAEVARLDALPAAPPQADASVTTAPGIGCAVLVADCLPVLFHAAGGRAVGAAHAGWRGLAAGVLERTVAALCELAGCSPAEVSAWLGPCIGPARFEVGADVLAAFGARDSHHAHFARRDRSDGSPRWLADLPALARARLAAAGVQRLAGGRWCTVEQRSAFYSFRRDGRTGRMAAAIAITDRPVG